MQLWLKRQEKGPDTNVRWVVGNLKVKGTKDCILRLQLFGWCQQIDQIRQIRTFAFFTTCQPENLATYVWENAPSYLTQFLLILSLKKWKLRRNGCDRIVWVTGAREISVVGGNRGRSCGFSGTLWPHTFLHLSSLLRKGKNTILGILLVEICISGSNVIGII